MNVDIPLNLLPWRSTRRQQQKQRHYQHLTAILLAVLMAATVLWSEQYYVLEHIKEEVATVRRELRKKAIKASRAQAIVAERARQAQAWQAISHSMQRHDQPLQTLYRVLTHWPRNAHMTRLVWEGDSLIVEGTAHTFSHIEDALKTAIPAYRCVERSQQNGRARWQFQRLIDEVVS